MLTDTNSIAGPEFPLLIDFLIPPQTPDKGTFHKMSPKHLQRYVGEFAGRHNIRELDTIDQMAVIASRLDGKLLPYRELIRDNGLPSGAHE